MEYEWCVPAGSGAVLDDSTDPTPSRHHHRLSLVRDSRWVLRTVFERLQHLRSGGNVCEWLETLYPNGTRGLAGSAWNHSSRDLGNEWENTPDPAENHPPYGYYPAQKSGDFGFRVAGK